MNDFALRTAIARFNAFMLPFQQLWERMLTSKQPAYCTLTDDEVRYLKHMVAQCMSEGIGSTGIYMKEQEELRKTIDNQS